MDKGGKVLSIFKLKGVLICDGVPVGYRFYNEVSEFYFYATSTMIQEICCGKLKHEGISTLSGFKETDEGEYEVEYDSLQKISVQRDEKYCRYVTKLEKMYLDQGKVNITLTSFSSNSDLHWGCVTCYRLNGVSEDEFNRRCGLFAKSIDLEPIEDYCKSCKSVGYYLNNTMNCTFVFDIYSCMEIINKKNSSFDFVSADLIFCAKYLEDILRKEIRSAWKREFEGYAYSDNNIIVITSRTSFSLILKVILRLPVLRGSDDK